MPIDFPCPQCGKVLRVPDTAPGQRGRCPSCRHIFTVSDPDAPLVVPEIVSNPGSPAIGSARAPGSAAIFRRDIGKPPTSERPVVRPAGPSLDTSPKTFQSLFSGMLCTGMLAPLGSLVVAGSGYLLDLLSPASTVRFFAVVRLLGFGAVSVGLVVSGVLQLIFLYLAWALIQDGRSRTTPGGAVGKLFVPIFNIYWIFVAIGGLAADLNRYGRTKGWHIRQASVVLAAIHAFAQLSLGLLLFAPELFLLMIPWWWFLVVLSSWRINNAVVDIAAAKAELRHGGEVG
jgi:hypothetical protein